MTTRYLICGGRDYRDIVTFTNAMNALILHPRDAVIIHGAAPGADKMADHWGRQNGAQVIACPADWDTLGKAAGPIRNATMLKDHQPDVVIAFPGGPGTEDMVQRARKAKLVVVQVV